VWPDPGEEDSEAGMEDRDPPEDAADTEAAGKKLKVE